MYLFNSSTTIIPQYITVLVDHSFSLFLGHLDKLMLLILPPSPCSGWFESGWLNTQQRISKILLCLHSMTSRKQMPQYLSLHWNICTKPISSQLSRWCRICILNTHKDNAPFVCNIAANLQWKAIAVLWCLSSYLRCFDIYNLWSFLKIAKSFLLCGWQEPIWPVTTEKERIRRFTEQEKNDPDEYGCSYHFTLILQFQRMQMQMEYDQGLLWFLHMSFNSSYVLLSTSSCSHSPFFEYMAWF